MKMLHQIKKWQKQKTLFNPEAELEEAVAPFGEDESFIAEATACNCDENCACGGNCGSNCNCHTGCEPMNESDDDYEAKKKALQDIQNDPNTAKDPELKKELMKRKAELEKMKEIQCHQKTWKELKRIQKKIT